MFVKILVWENAYRASQVALAVKNPPANAGDLSDVGWIPGSGKIPWRRAWQPTPVFLPRESHGQRRVVGYSPKSRTWLKRLSTYHKVIRHKVLCMIYMYILFIYLFIFRWYICIFCLFIYFQMVKRLPAMRETRVRFLGREDPLEKEMAIHSSTLAWKIPWTEEPDRLQSMGLQRVRHDWATSLHLYVYFKLSVEEYLMEIYHVSNSICLLMVD